MSQRVGRGRLAFCNCEMPCPLLHGPGQLYCYCDKDAAGKALFATPAHEIDNNDDKRRSDDETVLPFFGARSFRFCSAGHLIVLERGLAHLDADGLRSAAPSAIAVRAVDPRPPVFRALDVEIASHSDDDPPSILEHLECEARLNPRQPLVGGNRVTLLQNGPATYAAMLDAIQHARSHVNLETYIFDDGIVGRHFSSVLQDAARAGVRVTLIYDSIGTFGVPDSFFDSLRSAGVRLLEFHPINPAAKNPRLWRINNRDHRKMLIVDGQIAFVGGINISDTYSSVPSALHTPSSNGDVTDAGWRDTHLRIEGPAAAQFQDLFVETWRQHSDEPLDQSGFFPEPVASPGQARVRAIGSVYSDEKNPIFATLISAIDHAQSDVNLTVAYFAPDRRLLRSLTRAARRGVKVRMVLPCKADSWAIFHLGRSYYGRLLRGGVQVYERQGPVMHSKTASVDGLWSTVGSANLDWRSMLHNNEANAVVVDRAFAREMNRMFEDDIAVSVAFERRRWRRRSWWLRAQEFVSRLMAYFL